MVCRMPAFYPATCASHTRPVRLLTLARRRLPVRAAIHTLHPVQAMVLAVHMPERSNAGWYVGLAVAFAVIVVVVGVVAALLTYASRISERLRASLEALDEARTDTATLEDAERLHESVRGVLAAARTGRRALGDR